MTQNPGTLPAVAPTTPRVYENWREKFLRPMLLAASALGLAAAA